MEKLASRRVVFKVVVAAAVLLQLLHAGAVVQEIANCSTHCGNTSISYPFGIEPGCYHLGFNLSCELVITRTIHQSYSSAMAQWRSLGSGTVRINNRSIMLSSVPNAATDGMTNKTEVPHMDWPQKGWPGVRPPLAAARIRRRSTRFRARRGRRRLRQRTGGDGFGIGSELE
jgi:hypothetical protein